MILILMIVSRLMEGLNSYLPLGDEAFDAGLQRLGVRNKVLLDTQTPNSPDVNINDLGFFRALDAAFRNESCADEAVIIRLVDLAYQHFNCARINHVWISLLVVLNEIIRHGGGNDFLLPHLRKERQDREGELPIVLRGIKHANELLYLHDDL